MTEKIVYFEKDTKFWLELAGFWRDHVSWLSRDMKWYKQMLDDARAENKDLKKRLLEASRVN